MADLEGTPDTLAGDGDNETAPGTETRMERIKQAMVDIVEMMDKLIQGGSSGIEPLCEGAYGGHAEGTDETSSGSKVSQESLIKTMT